MLTDVQIRKAKPTGKGYRLTDSGGLHLFVTPAGAKLWRMRYEFGGKEKLLSIGPYPDLPLAEARKARDDAKATLRAGRDPSLVKKQRRVIAARTSEDTFEVVAREWHKRTTPTWTAHHAHDVLHSLEKDVFPQIGRAPIQDITSPEVLAVLRKVEGRGAVDMAHRIRQRMSSVFVYAIAAGRASTDPAAVVVKALAPNRSKRYPAITDLALARQMMRDVDATPGFVVTKIALRILALTNIRAGTLATTPWEEIDAVDPKDPVWRIPAVRMKLKKDAKEDEGRDHLVPLSKQAIESFAVLRQITGRGPLAFPNIRNIHKPMSENAMGYILNRAGYFGRHVPHGWRTTFSTVMNERFPSDRAVIDFMLAHIPKDKVESAYNRSDYLQRRKELAQIWADLIMEGQSPLVDLLSLPRRGRTLNPTGSVEEPE